MQTPADTIDTTGQEPYEQCGYCHEYDGNSKMAIYPRLAGQTAQYLQKQLRDFRSGKRKGTMTATAELLSDEEIHIVAEYFSGQPVNNNQDVALKPDQTKSAKQLVEQGDPKRNLPACISCHQPWAMGKDMIPRLAGQHIDYLLNQLKKFKTGQRTNDGSGQMPAISEQLTELEMQILAQYLASLTPSDASSKLD